jgi:hypothetical protein
VRAGRCSMNHHKPQLPPAASGCPALLSTSLRHCGASCAGNRGLSGGGDVLLMRLPRHRCG